MGVPGTALRSLMLDVLKATNALDTSMQLIDLDYILIADKNLSRWRGGGCAHRESESYERD